MTETIPAPPTTVTFDENNAELVADLRRVYLVIFDQFAMSIEDVTLEAGENATYARELLGILQDNGLVAEQEVNEDFAWQVIKPGTYDEATREQAEAAIDEFLGKAKETPAPVAPSATSPDGSPCLCGCGEATGKKSNYRPGHDARHAGIVGRKIASESTSIPDIIASPLLNTLPSGLLREKAAGIAEREFEKIVKREQRELAKTNKAAAPTPVTEPDRTGPAEPPAEEVGDGDEDGEPAPEKDDEPTAAEGAEPTEPQPVEGTTTVGKNADILARRWPNGLVEYLKNDEFVKASKAATAAFKEG